MGNYIFTYDDGVLYRNGIKMENTKEKLTFCPFCNSENVECIETSCGFDNNSKIKYYCTCHNCKIETPFFSSKEEAINYWNNSKKQINTKERTSKVKYDYNNWITYCENCGNVVNSNTDTYCNGCGSKLKADIEQEQKFINNYNDKYIHPYGWPLNKEQITKSIGKPVYIEKLNGDMCWKVINKIEINEKGYNVNFTDGSWHLFHELNIYDPTNIIKEDLYPIIKKQND